MAKAGCSRSRCAPPTRDRARADALGGLVIFDAVRLGYDWAATAPRAASFRSGWRWRWCACGLILLQALRQRTDKAFVSRSSSARCCRAAAGTPWWW